MVSEYESEKTPTMEEINKRGTLGKNLVKCKQTNIFDTNLGEDRQVRVVVRERLRLTTEKYSQVGFGDE